ncbi:DUF6344 domain-containing protein [Streptomyces ficellus]|uniref:DUF6344 domain-containing protein n=1 Tax=Streptomyces ficellus TaxID=1977088 RepID=A0ABT7Z3N9_9ACTN|nr:DUF6344 domain-containing protein [Streptomyces ficellus]MDN3294099.1 DUF6344 domain-containing protein [Streptomyces ficellus]
MAAVKVTQFWTAVFSLLSAVLAALGLKRTATATTAATAVQITATAVQGQAVRTRRPHAPAEPVHAAAVRERSLPPTIKQRIRAEAHGASPSVRHVPALGFATTATTDLDLDLALTA